MTWKKSVVAIIKPRRRSPRLAAASVVAKAVANGAPRSFNTSKKPNPGRATERMVAFLRGVNMFGGVHSMATIRDALTRDGFANVATFLISGNVVFDRPRCSNPTRASLERRIEQVLRVTFDQEIPVYVRSMSEMQQVLRKLQTAPTTTFYFGMLKRELTPDQRKMVAETAAATDKLQFLGAQFAVHATDPKRSVIYKASLEKTLGERVTVRKVNTWTRLVNKFGGDGGASQ